MMPRLMVVSPVYPPARGGIETLAEGIVSRWDGPAEVVTLREPGSDHWDAHAAYRVCRAPNTPRGGRRAIAGLTALAAARSVAFRPDIVVSMHVRCGRAAQLGRAATGARWVQYYHAKEIRTWPASSRRCAAGADHGIAVSRYAASLIASVRTPRNAVSVIPPAVDPVRPASREPRHRPTILTVARLDDEYKGHDVMLAALPLVRDAVPDVHWIVVGHGSLSDRLRDQARARGLADHIDFRGAVDDATRDELLASSHVFALPSRISADARAGEGFGIVYVEAAAAGLPVVAGNVGGAVDAVSAGRSGLLIDPADPHRVAAALVTLLTDDALRRRMSDAAMRWSERFTWDRVMPRLHAAITGDPARAEPASAAAPAGGDR